MVVVVKGATLDAFVTGDITMLIIGVLLDIVGLGLFCRVLFTLAIYALPVLVGSTAGSCSIQVGAGPSGAIIVGFVAGVVPRWRPGRSHFRSRALPSSASSLGGVRASCDTGRP